MGVRPLILLALLAGTAHAEPARTPKWELGFAIAGGAASIGDQTFGQIGPRFHLARRVVPDLGIALRVELLNTNRGSGDDLVMGETARFLTGLDWRVLARKFPIPDLFVLTGVGSELTAWDRGTVHRMLTYAGFEVRQSFAFPSDFKAIRGIRHAGMRYGFHLQIARDVQSMTLARACTLCDVPDAKRGFDVAFIGYYGIDFGR